MVQRLRLLVNPARVICLRREVHGTGLIGMPSSGTGG